MLSAAGSRPAASSGLELEAGDGCSAVDRAGEVTLTTLLFFPLRSLHGVVHPDAASPMVCVARPTLVYLQQKGGEQR